MFDISNVWYILVHLPWSCVKFQLYMSWSIGPSTKCIWNLFTCYPREGCIQVIPIRYNSSFVIHRWSFASVCYSLLKGMLYRVRFDVWLSVIWWGFTKALHAARNRGNIEERMCVPHSKVRPARTRWATALGLSRTDEVSISKMLFALRLRKIVFDSG